MSTRSTIVLATARGVVAHLYREIHDDAVHLELDTEDLNASINVVVPGPLVEGLAEMLRKSEDRT